MPIMNKSLYYQVNEILSSSTPTMSFVDMDGVLAEYKYGEGNLILSGDQGVYLDKRPIKTVIDFVAKYYNVNGNSFKILSSCTTKDQEIAKREWIKRHMAFFDLDDFMCVLSDGLSQRVDKKVDIICGYAKAQPHRKTLVIEDTHAILKKCWDMSQNQILPIHVINLIK